MKSDECVVKGGVGLWQGQGRGRPAAWAAGVVGALLWESQYGGEGQAIEWRMGRVVEKRSPEYRRGSVFQGKMAEQRLPCRQRPPCDLWSSCDGVNWTLVSDGRQ